jgi:hypothetical protein
LFPGCDIAAWQSPRRCWPLIRELITTSKMSQADAAPCLAHAFAAHITRLLTTAVAPPTIMPQFAEFVALANNRRLVGDRLLVILHAAVCGADLDECADGLEALRDRLDAGLLVEAISIFPAPALIPRVVRALVHG